MHRQTSLLFTTTCLVILWNTAPIGCAQSIDFGGDIQPILKRHCYECHDDDKKISGFRVDVRRDAIEGGESGLPGIVAGDIASSELTRRVLTDDESERMPPEGPGLSEPEKSVLKKWIADGANWPDEFANEAFDPRMHWAFQPPIRPPLPDVSDSAWCENAIDRFALAKLDALQLQPSPTADRITLCRRLYFDLTGLPPAPADVDAFLRDDRPDAYERLVERLLASPQFGVRHASPWLDAARYADSDGYEKDKQRPMWFYRDWVIGALNEDLPYDDFVIQQLAGDLIENADQQSRVATGFVRGSMINEEGGADPEQFRMEAMFDRMDALGKAMLGLTISCAQCHNHKFDPITQEEYYEIMAFLNSDHDANLPVFTPQQWAQREHVLAEIVAIEDSLKADLPEWKKEAAAWAASERGTQAGWNVVDVDWDENTSGGQKYLTLDDGSLLAQGYAPTKSSPTFTIRVSPDQLPITGIRLELLLHPNLPHMGPGRSIYGTGALSEIRMKATPLGEESGSPFDVQWKSATANVAPRNSQLDAVFDDRSETQRTLGPIGLAIDGDNNTAWGIDVGPGLRNQNRQAVFVPDTPIEGGKDGVELLITLTQNHGGWNSDDNQSHNLGRIRFAVTQQATPIADPLSSEARAAVEIPAELRSESQWNAIFSAWRERVESWQAANQAIDDLWAEYPEPESQLVLMERNDARPTFILKRGDFLSPTRQVEPGVPDVLNELPEDADASRLTLAKWIADERSPTTARALVNRIWQTYFGTALVSTPEDLGVQSPPPSHPDLLDWLAIELMENGWSQKHIHRLIVNSAVYRQRNVLDDRLREQDPTARMLTRSTRQRLPAEIVRDTALAASGLLNHRVGGPPIYPPLPEWMVQPPVSYGPKNWFESQGTERYRRGIYIHRYRSLPYPSLQVFDAPNGDASCVTRSTSNTPLQALTTLNDPTFSEAAIALGARLIRELPDATDQQRIEYGMRLCTGRKPDRDESQALASFVHSQRQRIAGGEIDAGEMLPEVAEDVEVQAVWTLLARVLLNLDETITRP